MGNPLNPGPPLDPGEEYCEADAPSGVEKARAVGAALLVTLAAAGSILLIGLVTGRTWAFAALVVGVAQGWAVNNAANRHRSRFLGIVAAGATFFSHAAGYLLLWLPLEALQKVSRSLSWYDLVMIGISVFVAYRLSGPRPEPKPLG